MQNQFLPDLARLERLKIDQDFDSVHWKAMQDSVTRSSAADQFFNFPHENFLQPVRIEQRLM